VPNPVTAILKLSDLILTLLWLDALLLEFTSWHRLVVLQGYLDGAYCKSGLYLVQVLRQSSTGQGEDKGTNLICPWVFI